jgi:hypothetical protein
VSLVVLNPEARFDCTFGRGCEGICCRSGRPPVYPEEIERIDRNLDRILPSLRPEASALVLEDGYLSRRRTLGQPMLRVVKGWCVFFNEGCVPHRLGTGEGDPFMYKPWFCAIFPLKWDPRDSWYVRQKGFRKERWALFCLDPAASTILATESLRHEMALADKA